MPNSWQGDPRTIRRGPPPPPLRRPFYPIHKVLGKDPRSFLIVSPSIVDVYVHSVGWRTKPCTGGDGDCWLDHGIHPPRWQGWIWVLQPRDTQPGLTWLTPELLHYCPAIRKHDGALHGSIMRLWRSSESRDSMLLGQFHDEIPRKEINVEVPDLLEVLAHILAAPDRRGPGQRAGMFPQKAEHSTRPSNGRATS